MPLKVRAVGLFWPQFGPRRIFKVSKEGRRLLSSHCCFQMTTCNSIRSSMVRPMPFHDFTLFVVLSLFTSGSRENELESWISIFLRNSVHPNVQLCIATKCYITTYQFDLNYQPIDACGLNIHVTFTRLEFADGIASEILTCPSVFL